MVEVEKEYGSKAAANSGLGFGIAGTALGLLNGGIGNLFGIRPAAMNGCCEGDHLVSRYDAQQSARIAELETEVNSAMPTLIPTRKCWRCTSTLTANSPV